MFLPLPHVFSVSHFKAALHGVRFNNKTLSLAWHKAVTTLNTVDADDAEPDDDEVSYSHFKYLIIALTERQE